MTREELFLLLPKNCVGIECGVKHGKGAGHILRNLNPKKLILVDTWKPEERGDTRYKYVCDQFTAEIASGLVDVIRADCAAVLHLLSLYGPDWIHADFGVNSYVASVLPGLFSILHPEGYFLVRGYLHENPANKIAVVIDRLLDGYATEVARSEKPVDDTVAILLRKNRW